MRGTGIAIFACAFAFGQATESLTFEVASVKPSAPFRQGVYFGPPRGGPGTPDPGRITWTYAAFMNLLMTAYDVKMYQISGPAWLSSERYDIAVKVLAGATKEQVHLMWQNLLAERFGVTLHHESREFQVEELVVARSGPKLKLTTVDLSAPLPPGPPKFEKNGGLAGPGMVTTILPGTHGTGLRTVARAQPLSKLTAMLGNLLHHPVLDKTGLTGNYDFILDFTSTLIVPPPDSPPPPPDTPSDPGLTLEAALQQQLGLRLVKSKATLDVLVIDKANKVPTEN